MNKLIIDSGITGWFSLRQAGSSGYFMVASLRDKCPAGIAAVRFYTEIASILADYKLKIVHERVFGSLSVKNEVFDARSQALRVRNILSETPLTYIQGCPPWGEGLAGINLHAVPEDGVETVFDGEVPCGHRWRQNSTEYFVLQNIHDLGNESEDRNNYPLQVKRMLERVEKILLEQRINYRHVVRTWFYLSHILKWYGEFNRVRSDKYREFGILSQTSSNSGMFPASTGIEGTVSDLVAGTLDVLAVIPNRTLSPIIKHLSNLGQKEAFHYGAAFSPGVLIDQPDFSWIQVSGTAAIDKNGNSMFPHDIRSQIQCTFDKLISLLKPEGAGLKDIAAATVFVKHPEDAEVFWQLVKSQGLEEFPGICVQANICREDLLFEIDAEVIIQKLL
jgi:enamine deaminase RidA (YjgF/YER057c/UK114 family)